MTTKEAITTQIHRVLSWKDHRVQLLITHEPSNENCFPDFHKVFTSSSALNSGCVKLFWPQKKPSYNEA